MKAGMFGLLLIFFIPLNATSDTIFRIGFIGPLTGSQAGYGLEAQRAIQFALDDLQQNNKSDIRFEAIFEDGTCAGKNAVTAAQKLSQVDKVQAIIGGLCSGETLAAAPIAERNQVVLISPFSSNPKISDAGEYIFRIAPDDVLSGKKAASLMHSNGHKKIAIITENADYPLGLEKVIQTELGKTNLIVERFNPEETNFKSQLLRIKVKQVEAIFLNPQGGLQGGLLVRQMRELGIDLPIYGGYLFSSSGMVTAAGGLQLVEGIRFVDIPPVTTLAGKSLLERIKKEQGKIQSEFLVAASYDAASLIAKSVLAGATNASQIKAYLDALNNYSGLAGTFHFDPKGDIVGIDYVAKHYHAGAIQALPEM